MPSLPQRFERRDENALVVLGTAEREAPLSDGSRDLSRDADPGRVDLEGCA